MLYNYVRFLAVQLCVLWSALCSYYHSTAMLSRLCSGSGGEAIALALGKELDNGRPIHSASQWNMKKTNTVG